MKMREPMDAVTLLLDPEAIAQIRVVEHAIGRNDLFSGLVAKLEGHLNGFGAAWSELMARGDTTAATRSAHTLKGTCRQLGAAALGNLFADIERSAKAGDYAEAKRRFEGGASLIAQSLEALKRA
ncbi:MAG: Hpt domain-containing protein [Betaproteobacteria bacterium]|nr:MAG: Hpt domain-containing protein [Betaproteobacteria bacterium]TMH43246.1 MAG: Hpt domain-containing protein [Betaproteobacteria bacterium]